MKKKSRDSAKNSEILFPDQTSFLGPTPLSKWRTDAERNDTLMNTSKNNSSVQKKVVSTVFSFISLSLYDTTFLVNILLLFNNLIYFISEIFFPKTREIGSLVVRQ